MLNMLNVCTCTQLGAAECDARMNFGFSEAHPLHTDISEWSSECKVRCFMNMAKIHLVFPQRLNIFPSFYLVGMSSSLCTYVVGGGTQVGKQKREAHEINQTEVNMPKY